MPTSQQQQAHLFVIAAPVLPRREMLLDAVHGDHWHEGFQEIKDAGVRSEPFSRRELFSPDLPHAVQFGRRADGAALTYGLTPDRVLSWPAGETDRYNEDALELELSEDGAVRILSTRLSDHHRELDEQVLFAIMIPVLTRRVLSMSLAIADRTGYGGPWFLGVAATGISGRAAHTPDLSRWGSSRGRLTQDHSEYRATAVATNAELEQTPGAVTSRLVGRLLRALGEAESLRSYTTDPEG